MVPAKSARSRPALRPHNIGNPARPLLMEAALWHGSECPIDSRDRLAFDYIMQVPGHDFLRDAFPIIASTRDTGLSRREGWNASPRTAASVSGKAAAIAARGRETELPVRLAGERPG
jgi:hypothetical protein